MSGVKGVALGLLGVLLCCAGSAARADEATSLKFLRQVKLETADRSGLGCSVAVAGERVVVGSHYDDDMGREAGSARVFRYNGTNWLLEQKLVAVDGDDYDRFGSSTAIAGDIIVVGAPLDEDKGYASGSVYVFRYSGTTWLLEQKLFAADAGWYDYFGTSLATDGETIVVAAPLHDDAGANAGSAYVYRHDGTSWVQTQELVAADAQLNDRFGSSVAIAGDRIVIGAHLHDDTSPSGAGSDSGSAYVYRYDGASWVQEQKLTPADADWQDCFGRSVAIAGDRIAVGAYLEDGAAPNSGSAYVFRHDGASWVEEQKLVAADGEGYELFGISLAIDGETIVVGAYLDDDRATNSGSAYIFRHDGTSWHQDQKLVARDASVGDGFGRSVALAEGLCVAGAPDGEGAAYVHRQGVNHVPVAHADPDLFAECTSPEGLEVTLDGSASADVDSTPGTNDAIVRFDWVEDWGLPTERWIDTGEVCEVVFAVGLHDVTLEVEDFPGDTDTDDITIEVVDTTPPSGGITFPADGAVLHQIVVVADDFTDVCDYQLDRVWEPGRGPYNRAGSYSVTVTATDDQGNLSSDTVGFTLVNEPPLADAGADRTLECAFVGGAEVRLDGSASTDPDSTPGTNDDIREFWWFEDYGLPGERTLSSNEIETLVFAGGRHEVTLRVTDLFQVQDTDDLRVEVVDTTPPDGGIFAPAPGSCHRRGALPVWVRAQYQDDCDPSPGLTWSPPNGIAKLLAIDGGYRDHFGQAVAIAGDTIVVGAPYEDTKGWDAGSAYVFRRDGASWVQQQQLVADDAYWYDYFGYTVAIAGDTIVIGAPYEDARGRDSGSAYVFRRDGTSWIQEQKLAPADGYYRDNFGYAVAVEGDTIVIGSYRDDPRGSDSGSAYVFRRDGTSWIQEQKLVPADGDRYDNFGRSVAIDGGTIVIGAPYEDARGWDSGSAYVFRHDGTSWLEEQKLVAADGAFYDNFGRSVAIDGEQVVVGAPYDDHQTYNTGSAYVFRHDGTSWIEEQKLLAVDGHSGDTFGLSVAIEGQTLLAGAPYDDDRGYSSGSAYVFRRDGTSWIEDLKATAGDGSGGDNFAYTLAIDGDDIVVGARYDDHQAYDSGSAYVFRYDRLYRHHGDYTVTLNAEDDAGNLAGDAIEFVVDLVPPAIDLLGPPDEPLLPSIQPFTDLFACRDDDEAAGDPVHERVFWDDCLVYDGLSYGDGDGLLSDETMVFDHPTLCAAMARCGLAELNNPTLRVEGFDCAGNRGFAERTHRLRFNAEHCESGPGGN